MLNRLKNKYLTAGEQLKNDNPPAKWIDLDLTRFESEKNKSPATSDEKSLKSPALLITEIIARSDEREASKLPTSGVLDKDPRMPDVSEVIEINRLLDEREEEERRKLELFYVF